jgi:hypothetical protein
VINIDNENAIGIIEMKYIHKCHQHKRRYIIGSIIGSNPASGGGSLRPATYHQQAVRSPPGANSLCYLEEWRGEQRI